MLLSRRRQLASGSDALATIHNYYERLVLDAIIEKDTKASTDQNFLADAACVALNHLPPRYIRHNVDMTFYLSPVELAEINGKIEEAVVHAIDFVNQRLTKTDSQ